MSQPVVIVTEPAPEDVPPETVAGEAAAAGAAAVADVAVAMIEANDNADARDTFNMESRVLTLEGEIRDLRGAVESALALSVAAVEIADEAAEDVAEPSAEEEIPSPQPRETVPEEESQPKTAEKKSSGYGNSAWFSRD